MLYDAKTPAEYLEQLELDWRKEKLEQIRNVIFFHGPDLVEKIGYKMLSYGDDSRTLFHLNAQKNYVSLYVGNIEKIDGAKEMLHGFNMGKGCIRIKKTKEVGEEDLGLFIKRAIDFWKTGGDTDC